MFKIILNKIWDILNANALLQEVYKYETAEFRGGPAATIVPSANEGDYNTTEENVRIYAFTVRLFVNRDIRTKDKADDVLMTLVSSVIDDFDKYYSLTALGTDGSAIPGGAIENATGYTFINIFAVPSVWGYVGREDEFRIAEIDVKCRVSVSLSSIS